MAVFVLVHSPLVGPSSFRWVADELRSRGHDVEVPRISADSVCSGWTAVVTDVARTVGDTQGAVFVAHSGAGPLLPAIVSTTRASDPRMVFVDAGIPAENEATPLVPAEFLAHLRELSRDGVLPRWSEWFEPDVLATLIPDDDKRSLFQAELRRLPLDYFAQSIPPVRPWPTAKNAYLLLSEPYADDAAFAAQRGWPVVMDLGQHLDIVTRPVAIAHHLKSIAARF